MILLGGEISDFPAVKKARSLCRVLICADGAVRHALKLGLEPDFIVGDMDSLPNPVPHFKKTIYRCDFSQQFSDFEKCLRLCERSGLKRLYIAGVLGGRLDHALVNLSLIERRSDRFEIVLLEQGSARLLGAGKYRYPLARGEMFSLLARPKATVSLSGAIYPLKKAELAAGSQGLSNKAIGPVTLQIHKGRLWFAAPNR
jgi:thiamine pyrophosphokinase